MCYPFQMAGTHDAFRPRAAFQDGLPSRPMSRSNDFFDAGVIPVALTRWEMTGSRDTILGGTEGQEEAPTP